ncbi:MAG: choice-of-anchor B family protein [Flavobacteriales bacterium]|nr:choice-of-anchor B family protein [Flavobacteriales bacterium]
MRRICLVLLVVATICSSNVLAQDSLNVSRLSRWTAAATTVYNEVWGIAQGGREYAIIGTWRGTYFIDVTDPQNPVQVAYVAGVDESCFCTHRDYHDYNGYLYMVTDEDPATLQIVDMSNLPNSVTKVYDSDILFNRSHNIFIDSTSGILYSFGGSPNAGISAYSLADPLNPFLMNNFPTPGGYIHDGYVRNDTMYAHAGGSGMFVYDFSVVLSPQLIGSLDFYPHKGYNHSGWLNKKGDVYVFADETKNKDVKVADVSDLSDILIVDTVNTGGDTNSMAHNVLIKDGLAYVSYYMDGLWIYDITNPSNTTVAGWYDMYVGIGDTMTGGGSWGVYPFLPSGNVLVSDMRSGLFVFDVSEVKASVESVKQKKPSFEVVPNPVLDLITMRFEEHVNLQSISVIDLSGRVVEYSEATLSGTSIEYSLGKLAPGQYLLNVTTDKGTFASKITKG